MLNITEILTKAQTANTMDKAAIVAQLNEHYKELTNKQALLQNISEVVKSGTAATIQLSAGSSNMLILSATPDVLDAFAANIKTALEATQNATATILSGGPYQVPVDDDQVN
jgi:hypothetical protein